MSKAILTVAIIVYSCMQMGCATLNKPVLPETVLELNPEFDCQDIAFPGSYKLKGELHQIDDITYLVFFLDPGYALRENPWVELKGGFAVYEGNRDKLYYFKLGKLVKSEEIGWFGFETNFRVKTKSGDTVYDDRIFRLVRKEDSSCLLMYHVSGTNLPPQLKKSRSRKLR